MADFPATASPPATLAASRAPPNRGLWYCDLIEPNAWGASEIRAAFWAALGRTATEQA
jgi:hypothetical protein